MVIAILAFGVFNLVLWGYIAAYPDRPECGQRDPLTAWLQHTRATARARRTTHTIRQRQYRAGRAV